MTISLVWLTEHGMVPFLEVQAAADNLDIRITPYLKESENDAVSKYIFDSSHGREKETVTLPCEDKYYFLLKEMHTDQYDSAASHQDISLLGHCENINITSEPINPIGSSVVCPTVDHSYATVTNTNCLESIPFQICDVPSENAIDSVETSVVCPTVDHSYATVSSNDSTIGQPLHTLNTYAISHHSDVCNTSHIAKKQKTDKSVTRTTHDQQPQCSKNTSNRQDNTEPINPIGSSVVCPTVDYS